MKTIAQQRQRARRVTSGNAPAPAGKPKPATGVGRFNGRGFCPACGRKPKVCSCGGSA